MSKYHHVLFAAQGGQPPAAYVVDMVRQVVHEHCAKLSIMRAAPREITNTFMYLLPCIADKESLDQEIAVKQLHYLAESLGVKTKDTVFAVSNNPLQAIVTFIKSHHIDLIIIDRASSSSAKSIADAVLQQAHCDILAVNPKEDA